MSYLGIEYVDVILTTHGIRKELQLESFKPHVDIFLQLLVKTYD
jgi:hypothetical protein